MSHAIKATDHTALLVSGTAKSPVPRGLWGSILAAPWTSALAVGTILAVVGTTLGIVLAPHRAAAAPTPGAGVSQIQLHYFNGSTTLVEVDFASSALDPSAGVEFGAGPSAFQYFVPAAVTSYADPFSNYTSPHLYRAVVDVSRLGSPPPAQVYYRVGGGGAIGGFSGALSFAPHPGVGVPGVTLAVVGDIGTTNNSVDTLRHMFAGGGTAVGAQLPFAAVLHVGDLSYADGEQPVWDFYGSMLEAFSARVPWQTSVGNHEWFDSQDYSFIAYRARYNMAAQLWYAFSIGLFRVVVLAGYCPEMKSSRTQPCLAPGAQERLWLEAELAAVNRTLTPWLVVVIHQPWMNSNYAHSIATEGEVVRAAIEDVLYAAHVDLVLAGHVHAYERCCRAYNYTCVPNGIYYITIGDGGTCEGLQDTWVTPQPAWSVFRQASYGHGRLTGVNSTHAVWRWFQNPDLVPTVADELWIVKSDTSLSRSDAAEELAGGDRHRRSEVSSLGQPGPLAAQEHVSGRTGTPVFSSPAAEEGNARRVSLGGKYCHPGWSPPALPVLGSPGSI